MLCTSARNININASTLFGEGYGLFHSHEPAFKVDVNPAGVHCSRIGIVDQIRGQIQDNLSMKIGQQYKILSSFGVHKIT
jgi:hypothetical protein